MNKYTYWNALDKSGKVVGVVASATLSAAADLAEDTWPGVVGVHFSHEETSE